MKKTWVAPKVDELTITATTTEYSKRPDGPCGPVGDGDTFSPDEFHPERFTSGAVVPTKAPFQPSYPGRPGGGRH